MNSIDTIIFDSSGIISGDCRPVYEANMRILEAFHLKRMTFE